MTERWESKKKKFCEICKCWFADNPNAIRHHESGTRHIANVQGRIRSIGAQSREKEKAAKETNKIIAAMTAGALRSHIADMEGKPAPTPGYRPAPAPSMPSGPMYPGASGPDLQADRHSSHAAFTPGGMPNAVIPPPPQLTQPSTSRPERRQYKEGPHSSVAVREAQRRLWAEALSDDGHSYYFHIESGQTTWTTPTTGFLSLMAAKVKEEEEEEKAKTAPKFTMAFTSGAGKLNFGPQKPAKPERDLEVAKIPLRVADLEESEGEVEEEQPRKRKERKPRPISKKEQASRALQAKIAEKEAEMADKPPSPKIMYAAGMPGGWTSVPAFEPQSEGVGLEEEEGPNDLGLPELPEGPEYPEFPDEEDHNDFRFGQKTVASLQEAKGAGKKKAGAPVEFKKRKLGGGARNARRRDDD